VPRHVAVAPTSYVIYVSRVGHFQIDVPQGWPRIESADTVTFSGKGDGESVRFASGACASGDPRVELAGAVMHAGDFVANVRIEPIALPAGPAYRAEYETSATAPGAEDARAHVAAHGYLLRHSGRCALITLWASFGTQDVDQWQRVARSFRWR
jgi:hypothetical protein